MSFLSQLVNSKSKETIQRMQTDIKLSKPMTGDNSHHEYLLQKLEVLFDYLLKIINQKDIQLKTRLEAFSNEDSGILGKAIKLVLYSRSPNLLTIATLARE